MENKITKLTVNQCWEIVQQQLTYISRNIYKIMKTVEENTRVIFYVYQGIFLSKYQIHRFIFNIPILGSNLAGFDDNEHKPYYGGLV